MKLLGITIQNDLKWESHVKDIEKRANAKLYMLRSLAKFGLSHEDLITVFIGYIRPILEYATPVWSGGLTFAQKERLERIQKRALRIIFGKEYQSYATALTRSKLMTLESRWQELCINFFKKTLLCINQFKQFIAQRVHNRSLRKTTKIPEPRCKTKRMQNSPIPNLIRLYNKN